MWLFLGGSALPARLGSRLSVAPVNQFTLRAAKTLGYGAVIDIAHRADGGLPFIFLERMPKVMPVYWLPCGLSCE
jgi:hypothetical protein